RAAGAHPGAVDRLLRHLAAAGVLTRDATGRHALAAPGEALREGHPAKLRAMLDLDSAIGRADTSFVHLLHCVRTGEPAFPVQFGRSFWDDLADDPERTASFDAQMSRDVSIDAPVVARSFDWSSLGHLVDVGGGDGALLAELLRAHPTLRGTVLDLPATAATARSRLAAAGLADRADAVGGSFFDPLPPGAGGYLLSAIVHDWPDDAARTILRRCGEAAGPTGRVLVLEHIGPDGRSIRTGMDLRMLAYFGGRERTGDEIAALAAGAGLRLRAVHPAGELALVELAAVEPGRGGPTG
ncbi:MAG TPA: methyltransferase, partial [Pilimelia sp.]|nr:methyltransferase [Pilimelia sp.]